MPISLLLREKFDEFDSLILMISRELLENLRDIIVRVDSFDDCPAVRVVVREKNWEVIDRILETVRGFEKKHGLDTPIIVHIDEADEI